MKNWIIQRIHECKSALNNLNAKQNKKIHQLNKDWIY